MTNDHPFTGHTGVSMYCRDVIPRLADSGVDVGVICIQNRDWQFRPYIRVAREHGITLFRIVNTSLFPENSLYAPSQDVRHPAIERLVRWCLRQFRPDVFHIQTFHGYPGAIVFVAKELGIPTVVSLHDFWAICPRVLLMRPKDEACNGPDEGRNCMQFCVQARPLRQHLYQWGTRLPEGWMQDAFFYARSLHRQWTRRQTSMWTPLPVRRRRDDHALLSQHAARSIASLQALNAVDEILAVSEFVKSVFVRHGISAHRIRTLPPTLSLDGIVWRQRHVRGPLIRFAFLGRAIPLKGAHIFAQACRDVPANRARFLMFGPASPETQRYLQSLSGDGRLEFQGPYSRHELPGVLDQVDVVVVPSVAQETVGLVSIEAQAAGVPVVGSRIGAIPEYVQDGVTGLLFRSGDPRDLRIKMLRIINSPDMVATMSARTQFPIPMSNHIDGLREVYGNVTKQERTARWTGSLA